MNQEIHSPIEENPDVSAMAAKYGHKVIESGGEAVFDVNKYEISGGSAENVRFALSILLEFANSPIITDEFQNHPERRLFRKEIIETDPKYYANVQNNKLRGNLISSAESAFSIILKSISDTDMPEETKKEIKLLTDELPMYDADALGVMVTEERVKYVRQIDATIMKLFNLLRSQSSPEERTA